MVYSACYGILPRKESFNNGSTALRKSSTLYTTRTYAIKHFNMGDIKTSEELKEERIRVLGKEFGTFYDSMYNDYLWLYSEWKEYKELYGTKRSRIELLNKAAPYFFFVVQRVLFENILLGICKLTDPPTSFGGKISL